MGRKVKFNDKWFLEKDSNGNTISEYARRDSDFMVECLWCQRKIDTSGRGKNQILTHAKTKRHRLIAEGRTRAKVACFSDFMVPKSNSSAAEKSSETEGATGTKSLADRIIIAELRLCLKTVESNYSYSSFGNPVDVLNLLCDPMSEIFTKMQMK